MAASFNESQKLDYLWKKVGYGVTKTAEATSKEAFNESIASPLLYRGDLIWAQSGDIPSTPPASTTSLVQVYKDGGGGGYTATVECTEDLTAPDNQTWKTNLTNWIPTQFGDNYLVQVYVANTGVLNPQTAGTKLFAAGSGTDDTWFFDYQSGILNFNGANIPSQIAGGIAGKSIYIVGYRYVGLLGISTTSISSGTSNVNVVSSGGNVTVGIGGTGNVLVFANTGAYVTGLISASGNITGGNINTAGQVSASGNITANFFIGNGSQLTGIDATSIQNGSSNVKVYANANVATSVNGNANIFLVTGTGVVVTGTTSVTGNITSGNITTAGVANIATLEVTATANVVGNITTTANVSGGFILGNGSQLTGIDATSIQNGTSNVRVIANGNVTVSVAGTSNVVVFASTGEYITGLLSVTGNVTAGNVTTSTVSSTSALTVATGSNGNILLSADGTGIVKITGGTGFVVPVGNTAQRPVPVDDGTLRLNSTLNALEVYAAGGWQIVGSGTGNITVTDQQITPDGTNTVYTLDQVTTAPSIMVAINGVTQTPNDGYTVTGNLITFVEAPLSSDYVDVRFLTSAVATPGSLYNTDADSSVQVNDVPEISFTVNNTVRTKITANGIVDISTGRSIKMPLYTVSQADALTGRTEGEMIYVQNGDSGAACLAVFTGGAWKRVVLGAAISG